MFCFSTVTLIHLNNIVCCNEQGIYFISCISRSRKWLCQLSTCVDLDQISFPQAGWKLYTPTLRNMKEEAPFEK